MTEAASTKAASNGAQILEVRDRVKHFGGIRQQPVLLPADGDLPGLRMGVMANLRLQGVAATAE